MAIPFILMPSTRRKILIRFAKPVLLAEMLEVRVIVGFFPAVPAALRRDTQPELDYLPLAPRICRDAGLAVERKNRSILEECRKLAREHGVKRLALEMHPNFVCL